MHEQAWSSPVVRYCTEEVARQGHNVTKLDGIRRTAWMLSAWDYAMSQRELGHKKPTVSDVEQIGKLIEQRKNAAGFRTCQVYVGGRAGANPLSVARLLVTLFESMDKYSPVEFYKEFEEIHPFEDGNGRTGKVLLNWVNGTLHTPIFPPSDLWGREIQNP